MLGPEHPALVVIIEQPPARIANHLLYTSCMLELYYTL